MGMVLVLPFSQAKPLSAEHNILYIRTPQPAHSLCAINVPIVPVHLYA